MDASPDQNKLEFVMSADTTTGVASVQKFTQELKTMGAEGVKAQDALTQALIRTVERHDGTSRRMREAAAQVASQWAKTGEVIDAVAVKPQKITGPFDLGHLGSIASSGDAAKRSLLESQVAAQGLGREIGVSLPRVVTRFLAQSELIGSALNAAFSTVAIVGILEVVGTQLIPMFGKLEGAVTGWDKTSQQAYDHLVKDNMAAFYAANKLRGELAAIRTNDKGPLVGNETELAPLEARIKQLVQANADIKNNQLPALYTRRAAQQGGTLEIARLTQDLETNKRLIAEAEAQAKPLRDKGKTLAAGDAKQDSEKAIQLDQIRVKSILAHDQAIAEGKAAAAKQVVAIQEASVKGQIEFEQDRSAYIAQIDVNLENGRYEALRRSFAARRALANREMALNKDEAERQLADLHREEQEAEITHQNKALAIQNGALAVEAANYAKYLEYQRETQLDQLEFERDWAKRTTDIRTAAYATDIKDAVGVEQARLEAELAGAQRRMALNADVVQHANLTASQQVAMKLALDRQILESERATAQELFEVQDAAKVAEIHNLEEQIDDYRKQGMAVDDLLNKIKELNAERDIGRIRHDQTVGDIGGRERKAEEDAARQTRQRQDAIVSSISGDITRMFTDRLTHANVTFWESFKKLGQDAIASVTKFFLDNLIKGLLDPFKGVLDQTIQQLGASLRGAITGRAVSAVGLGSVFGGRAAASSGPWSERIPGLGSSAVSSGIFSGGILGSIVGHSVGTGAAPGAIGVLGPDGGLITGAGAGGTTLFGMGLGTAIPVLGGIAAGIFGLYELFHRRRNEPPTTPDPYANVPGRSMYFNTTKPFEDLTNAIKSLNQTNARVASMVASFETKSPGMVMKDGLPAVTDQITDSVATRIGSDRGYRRTFAGAILEQSL